MTLRDYRCNTCAEIFEEDVPMGTKPLVTCPICSSGDVKRFMIEISATVQAWWNAGASSDVGDIRQRYKSPVRSKFRDRAGRRYREKERIHGND
jgi:putative FmdB family regulatory protein